MIDVYKELNEANARIAELEAQLTAKDKEVGELKKYNGIYDASRKSAWSINEDLESENAILRKEVDRLKGREETVTKMIESEAQYEKMAHKLTAELTRIAELEAEVELSEAQSERHRQMYVEQFGRVNELEAENAILKAELNKARRDLDILGKKIW
jgi:chromosome segregation ATPase